MKHDLQQRPVDRRQLKEQAGQERRPGRVPRRAAAGECSFPTQFAAKRPPPGGRYAAPLVGLALIAAATVAPHLAAGYYDLQASRLLRSIAGIAAGFASFVMTGSGAYPLIPALLAILVLRERLAPNQYLGVAVLVAGLVALGLQS